MGILLYKLDASAPVRSVYMVMKALDLPDVEYTDVNLLQGEHLTEEFLKMNPQHTVPTLIDDDFIIWDSHAISCYLVSKYADNDVLYPSDPKKRAIVDQRLFFDSGILFPALREAVEPPLFWGTKTIRPEAQSKIKSAYVITEKLLSTPWLAGDEMTLADICCVATISTLNVVFPIKADLFPNLSSWLQRCSDSDMYKTGNEPGLEQFRALITSKLSS